MKCIAKTALLAALACLVAAAPQQEDLKAYQKVEGVSGNLSSVGSDTLNNLMALWAEGFYKNYPNVKIQVEGKGSTTAPPALIEGVAQLGPMSREMKPTETDKFESKYGYKPTQLRVALDALAVYVNKDNPLTEITLEQVDAIFSKSRKRRFAKDIKTWGDLGLTGDWANRPISMFGRNSASGTYGFFKEVALSSGDFKDTVKEQPGSASVVVAITDDRYAIGYSGMGYSTSGVKKLKIADKAGSEFVPAEATRVLDETYPLRRFLFIYVNRNPKGQMDPLLREFCTYIVSKDGQECVSKDGFIPVPAVVGAEELKKIR